MSMSFKRFAARSFVPLVAVSFASWAVANPAALTRVERTASFGGPGGGPFENACPVGSVMTGLRYREGAWVDAVGPICSHYDRADGQFYEVFKGPLVGGNGGGPGELRCEARELGVITALAVTRSRNRDHSVGSIVLECGRYPDPAKHANGAYSGNPQDDYLIGNGNHDAVDASDELACKPPLVAGGIYGKSGVFVDRIGLLCVDYEPRR